MREDRASPDRAANHLVRAELARVMSAEDDYKSFHWGNEPQEYIEVDRPVPVGRLWALGPCTRVHYLATKGSDGLIEYYHDFEGDLPLLVCDEDGRLFLCGGSYEVTEDGIEG